MKKDEQQILSKSSYLENNYKYIDFLLSLSYLKIGLLYYYTKGVLYEVYFIYSFSHAFDESEFSFLCLRCRGEASASSNHSDGAM